jgi:hypothetical protein
MLRGPSLETSTNAAELSRSAVWPKRLLIFAAAWNILGGIGALLDPVQHFQSMYSATLELGEPLQLYFFQCVWINVIAWGVGYLVAAFKPAARLGILAAGGLGKLAYGAACFGLVASGVGGWLVLAAGVVDVALAIVFAGILLAERKAT